MKQIADLTLTEEAELMQFKEQIEEKVEGLGPLEIDSSWSEVVKGRSGPRVSGAPLASKRFEAKGCKEGLRSLARTYLPQTRLRYWWSARRTRKRKFGIIFQTRSTGT